MKIIIRDGKTFIKKTAFVDKNFFFKLQMHSLKLIIIFKITLLFKI